MPTLATQTLSGLVASALDVLDAWGRAASPDVTAALTEAIGAGAEPALVVTASPTGAEVHIALRSAEGAVLPIARVFVDAPTDLQ